MAAQWRKSSYSGAANDEQCVEVGRLEGGFTVGVRDSKGASDGPSDEASGGVVRLSRFELGALVAELKARPVR
ncbi:hypothetical protein BJF79_17845 [Actinomadura sp. CNU-125]|uniref:DUF397 domain-containing protein n=1 Tax=Actinomadura sp. CNU-125 TaxID=1904961 RepID=UPI000965E086|nr:DUF397 domain-containing protein [Actinomadura sp. CNU-125]OLT17416.1 hypothetical protein BJF79_17845 [Actinomadura sp. CNU-125]